LLRPRLTEVGRADHRDAHAAELRRGLLVVREDHESVDECPVREDVDDAADRPCLRAGIEGDAWSLPARAAVRRPREPRLLDAGAGVEAPVLGGRESRWRDEAIA